MAKTKNSQRMTSDGRTLEDIRELVHQRIVELRDLIEANADDIKFMDKALSKLDTLVAKLETL